MMTRPGFQFITRRPSSWNQTFDITEKMVEIQKFRKKVWLYLNLVQKSWTIMFSCSICPRSNTINSWSISIPYRRSHASGSAYRPDCPAGHRRFAEIVGHPKPPAQPHCSCGATADHVANCKSCLRLWCRNGGSMSLRRPTKSEKSCLIPAYHVHFKHEHFQIHFIYKLINENKQYVPWTI